MDAPPQRHPAGRLGPGDARAAPQVQALLDAGRLRPFFLLESARTREIEVEELRSVDPQLDSLRNTNTPDDYQAALRDAGCA